MIKEKSSIKNKFYEKERRREKRILRNFKVTANIIRTAQLNLIQSVGFLNLNVLIIDVGGKVELNLLEHKEEVPDLVQRKKRLSWMSLLELLLVLKAKNLSVSSAQHTCLLFHPKLIAVDVSVK